MIDRTSEILKGLDIDRAVGLEIGPLDKPLVERDGSRQIFYADYAPRKDLVQASLDDPNVDTAKIPEIDYIVAPLPQSLNRKFDYIVASHVGEHVPDLIGWIKTLLSWLNDDGVLILALPDKRYTFDCYRVESTAGQLIEAHLQKRMTPPASSIYDGFSKAVRADAWYLWEGVEPPSAFENIFTKEDALSLAKTALENGTYRDCHCWVFSAESFQTVLNEVLDLGLIEFKWARFSPPKKYTIEFYVAFTRKNGRLHA
ncbi:class I SAM-dependent methyltransferase [Endobacterium cereale]|uniref:class I SAM-dependent methyltransferase n=1 Tax=Endobacterium cereale TaxID=2663029 RepID=UPI002B467512|nr:methyltransferase domain-containing protein [Endobacterium cereale]MEB2848288.1 methyltransferase domain-containing protein [Endobacterium cereale]